MGNKNFYKSWCLKGSDGTWGGPCGWTTSDESDESDAEDIDARARNNASTLFNDASDVATFLSNYDGCTGDDSLSSSSTTSSSSLTSDKSSFINHSNDVCPKR